MFHLFDIQEVVTLQLDMQIRKWMLMFFGLAMVLVVEGAVVAQVTVHMLFRADWIKWGRDQMRS